MIGEAPAREPNWLPARGARSNPPRPRPKLPAGGGGGPTGRRGRSRGAPGGDRARQGAPSEGPTEEPPAEEPRRGSAVHRIDPVHRPHRRDRGGKSETLAALREAGGGDALDRSSRTSYSRMIESGGADRAGGAGSSAGRRRQSRPRRDRLLGPRRAGLPRCCIRESAFTSSSGERISAPTWRSQSSRCHSSSKRRWRRIRRYRGSSRRRQDPRGSAPRAWPAGARGEGGPPAGPGGEGGRQADHVIRNEGSIEELESRGRRADRSDQKRNRGMSLAHLDALPSRSRSNRSGSRLSKRRTARTTNRRRSQRRRRAMVVGGTLIVAALGGFLIANSDRFSRPPGGSPSRFATRTSSDSRPGRRMCRRI